MTIPGKIISKNNFPDIPQDLTSTLTAAAASVGIKRFALVGGVVRDWLLTSENQKLSLPKTDIDIVVEGSAIELAKRIQHENAANQSARLICHEAYDTARITLNDINIDISSARSEIYPRPGENPKVERCTLEKDLFRRDFTVNALAIELPKGVLIDLYNGQEDLTNKKLNFIHSRSVTEDPTRVIRAARYASRLGLELTKDAYSQIKETIKVWPWDSKDKDVPPALSSRLKMELDLIFEQEDWEEVFKLLETFNALDLIDESLQTNSNLFTQIHRGISLGINPILLLVSGSKNPINLANRLNLHHRERRFLTESMEIKKLVSTPKIIKNSYSLKPSEWCKIIEDINPNPYSVALAACITDSARKPLLNWWTYWRKVTPDITAKNLLENQFEEGPLIGKELNRLRLLKIDRLYGKNLT